jgi:hypothetical protein
VKERLMTIRPITIVLIAVGVCSMVGCARTDSLSGIVTYNGEPVESGSIAFESADGSGPGFGAEVVNGQYEADKVRRGPHVALVRGLTKPPALTRDEFAKLREQRDNKYGLPIDYIPDNAEGNGQTIEVEGGSQSLDFELKGPPRSR